MLDILLSDSIQTKENMHIEAYLWSDDVIAVAIVDKFGSIMKANLTQDELEELISILESMRN